MIYLNFDRIGDTYLFCASYLDKSIIGLDRRNKIIKRKTRFYIDFVNLIFNTNFPFGFDRRITLNQKNKILNLIREKYV